MTTRSELMHGIRGRDRWHCRLLFLVCLLVLWPVAMVARVSGWRWQPWPHGSSGYQSAYREAHSMAEIVVGTVLST